MTAIARRAALALALAFGIGFAGPARDAAALHVRQIAAFGDSNVDSGNLAARGAALTPPVVINHPPNFGRRNNNRPVVVEYLALALGRPLVNFGVSGASTGPGFVPVPLAGHVGTQIGAYLASVGGRADPNALFVCWAGSNDLIGVGSNTALRDVRVAGAIANMTAQLTQPSDAGATRIVVANRTPRPSLAGVDNGNGLALNAAIAAALGALDPALAADPLPFDGYPRIADMVLNPAGSGFSRVGATDLCIGDPACAASRALAARWVNWDAAHKTTRARTS